MVSDTLPKWRKCNVQGAHSGKTVRGVDCIRSLDSQGCHCTLQALSGEDTIDRPAVHDVFQRDELRMPDCKVQRIK